MSEEEKVEVPKYCKCNADGTVTVHTREGDFTLDEEKGEVTDAVLRLKEKFKWTDFRAGTVLAARCCITPKLGDEDLIKNYKKSTVTKVMEGYALLGEDIDDFLSDTTESTQTTTGKQSSVESVSDSTKPQTS